MKFVPVIFGGYVNGYSIVRTFYDTYKIKSIVCDYKKRITCYSSFCTHKIVSDPKSNEASFLKEIKKIGIELQKKNFTPVIIATNDEWLIPLSMHRHELEDIFIYSFSEWDTIEKLTIKENLYKYCDELDIKYPKTAVITKGDFEEELEMKAPLLIKPSEVVKYIELFPGEKRNNIFNNVIEVKKFAEEKFSKGYSGKFILQEYIPGGIENLYTITTYSDRIGRLKGASIGHKLTQNPPEAGTITSGMIKYDEKLPIKAKKILEHCKYHGITNIEFKFDSRDNEYKMIEINPRPGMWNYSAYLSGLNLFEMMIDDIIYNKELEYVEGKKEIVWSIINKDTLLKNIKETNNYQYVKEMIANKAIINPLINSKENAIYKIRYRIYTALLRIREKLK